MRKGALVAAIVGAIGLLSYLTVNAVAATGSPTAPAPNAGQGLEISPPVVQLSANPGQTITTTINVRDISGNALAVTSEADDFGAKDETGDPKILLNETGATRYSLKYWVQPLASFQLAPQQIEPVTVTIAVPANAEPGGHYGVIRFTGLPPSAASSNSVGLTASIGSLVLMRVNGPITQNLSLVQLFATTLDGHSHSWFASGPIVFNERIHNGGTIHEAPAGALTITNTLGGAHVATLKVNPTGGNILPDSIRHFNQVLYKNHLFGRYRAQLNLSYGSPARKLTGQMIFWVIPWKLLLIVFLIALIIALTIWRSIRGYNRWILRRARHGRR